MWWVLLCIAILIVLEKSGSLRTRIPQLFKPQEYFWLFLNLVVLSMVTSALMPAITGFFDFFYVQRFIDLVQYPVYLQFLVFLLVVDFLKFGTHYFLHRFQFLWKIHSIHHSSEEINTLAAFKHSWLEAFLNLFLISLLSRVLVVEFSVLGIINTLLLSVCIWQHSKIRYINVPILSAVFVTPKNHRIHHELRNDSNHQNYGLFFNVWDRLFGTFTLDEGTSPKYGITEPSYPYESKLKQFFYPFFR